MDAATIKSKYPGYAGWNDPRAIEADFKATGGQGKGPPSDGGGGGDNVDYSGAKAFAAEQAKQTQALLDRQRAEEEKLFGAFQIKVAGQETLPAAYTRLSTEQGIPGLQSTLGTFQTKIASTKDLLDRLEENINVRTKGTLTSEPERQRLLAAEQYPLSTELGRLGAGMAPVAEALSTATGNVGQQLQLESAQQQRELMPIETQLSMFGDRAAREISGFTTGHQNQLNILMDELKTQGTLSLEKMREASALAVAEKEYQRAVDVEKMKTEQLIKLSKGGMLYDPVTGTYRTAPGTTGGGDGDPNILKSNEPANQPSGAYRIKALQETPTSSAREVGYA